MIKANQFQRGAGVYACRCCSRPTRGTGGDSAGVLLCDQCYELSGYENMLSDGDEFNKNEGAQVLALVAELKANPKATKLEQWDDLVTAAKFAVENLL